jgi:hypothetical protein
MPRGHDWMVVRTAEGFILAILAMSVCVTAHVMVAIRAAVAALPPLEAQLAV